jgi:hypothetical protein
MFNIFKKKNEESPEKKTKEALEIISSFASIIEKPNRKGIYETKLPYPKSKIRDSIFYIYSISQIMKNGHNSEESKSEYLQSFKDNNYEESLKMALTYLAEFQDKKYEDVMDVMKNAHIYDTVEKMETKMMSNNFSKLFEEYTKICQEESNSYSKFIENIDLKFKRDNNQ